MQIYMWCGRVLLTFSDVIALSVCLGFDYVALDESLHDLLQAADENRGWNSHKMSNNNKRKVQHTVPYLVSGRTIRGAIRTQAFADAKLQSGEEMSENRNDLH